MTLDPHLYADLLKVARRCVGAMGDRAREPEDLLHDAWPSIDRWMRQNPGATHSDIRRVAWTIIPRRHVDEIRRQRGRTIKARPLVCYTDEIERTAPTEESPEETRDFLRVLRGRLDPARRQSLDAIGRAGTVTGAAKQLGEPVPTVQSRVQGIKDAAQQLIGAA